MIEARFSPFISYPIVIALGAGLGLLCISKSTDDKAAMKDFRDSRHDRTGTVSSGEQLVTVLLADIKAETEKLERANRSLGDRARFRELLESLPPAADRAAAFQDVLKQAAGAGIDASENNLSKEQLEILATLGVRYEQWFLSDPTAASTMFSSDDPLVELTLSYYIEPIFGDAIQAKGVRDVLTEFSDIKKWNWVMFHQIFENIGSRGSQEDLTWIMESHPELFANKQFQSSGGDLGRKWAIGDRDALPGLLKGGFCAQSMLAIAKRMEGTSGAEWIKSWIDAGTLDAEALKTLSANGGVEFADIDGTSTAQRVDMIRQLGAYKGTDDKRLKADLISNQINKFLSSDSDWLYAFRHGAVSANELFSAALAACPDPGDAKPEFRTQIFRHLSEDDLGAAIKLLDGMPEDQKDWQKIWGARWWFDNVDPDKFLKVVSTIPYEGSASKEEGIRDAWRGKAGENLERFGEDYLTWAKSLPDGKQRTWALESIEQASKSKYPWINKEVKIALEVKP